ncbi:MAG: InlB B-repeat-containing protein, partial [Clostridiales bacterium]|nr:InlB B-repeat-containing protein [Clostridiales bacterium]
GTTPPSLPNGNPFPSSLKQVTVPASAPYKAVNDGNTGDNLWYGMAIHAPSEITTSAQPVPPPPPSDETPQPSGEQPPASGEQPTQGSETSTARTTATRTTASDSEGESGVLCTVTINTNGGTQFDNIQIPAGELIPPAANVPEREGFAFSGWYKDPELTTLWDFAAEAVEADMTLYAGWTALEGVTVYKITSESSITGGRLIPSPAEAIPGETIVVSAVPDEGKRLKAGSITADGTALQGYTFKMPEHDVVLNVQFEDIPKSDDSFFQSRTFKLLAVIAAIAVLVVVIVMLAMRDRIKKLNSDY